MSEPLSVSFPYRPDQHAGAMLEASLHRIPKRWNQSFVVLMLFLGVFFTASAIAEKQTPANVLSEGGLWFGLAALWGFGPGLLVSYTRRSGERKRAAGDRIELREFSDEGFRGSADWAQPVPWFLVDRVVETPNFFLVYSTNTEPSWVPKAELKTDDMDRLRELFQLHSTRVTTSPRER